MAVATDGVIQVQVVRGGKIAGQRSGPQDVFQLLSKAGVQAGVGQSQQVSISEAGESGALVVKGLHIQLVPGIVRGTLPKDKLVQGGAVEIEGPLFHITPHSEVNGKGEGELTGAVQQLRGVYPIERGGVIQYHLSIELEGGGPGGNHVIISVGKELDIHILLAVGGGNRDVHGVFAADLLVLLGKGPTVI